MAFNPPNGLSKFMSAEHPVFMLSKLSGELVRLRETSSSNSPIERIWQSMNCAITAWHCHEWYWQLSDDQQRGRLARTVGTSEDQSVGKFGVACQQRCLAVALCRQIGTAAKHLEVTHDRPHVRTEPWSHEKEGVKTHAVYIFDGDDRYPDWDVYRAAFKFWSDLAVRARLVSVDTRGQLRAVSDAIATLTPMGDDEFDSLGDLS